jgi:hypothetical protein
MKMKEALPNQSVHHSLLIGKRQVKKVARNRKKIFFVKDVPAAISLRLQESTTAKYAMCAYQFTTIIVLGSEHVLGRETTSTSCFSVC